MQVGKRLKVHVFLCWSFANQCQSPWVKKQQVFYKLSLRIGLRAEVWDSAITEVCRNGSVAPNTQIFSPCTAHWGHSDTKLP